MSRSRLLIRLSLRSDPKMMCVIRGALAPLTEGLGLAPEEVRSVVLAVDEALTNVIRHAYLGRLDRPIEISFWQGQIKKEGTLQGSLEIVIVDRGVPLKDEEMRGRALEDVRPGGLGLHFIRQSMDKVEFRHDKGKNYLRMVKALGPSQFTQGPPAN